MVYRKLCSSRCLLGCLALVLAAREPHQRLSARNDHPEACLEKGGHQFPLDAMSALLPPRQGLAKVDPDVAVPIKCYWNSPGWKTQGNSNSCASIPVHPRRSIHKTRTSITINSLKPGHEIEGKNEALTAKCRLLNTEKEKIQLIQSIFHDFDASMKHHSVVLEWAKNTLKAIQRTITHSVQMRLNQCQGGVNMPKDNNKGSPLLKTIASQSSVSWMKLSENDYPCIGVNPSHDMQVPMSERTFEFFLDKMNKNYMDKCTKIAPPKKTPVSNVVMKRDVSDFELQNYVASKGKSSVNKKDDRQEFINRQKIESQDVIPITMKEVPNRNERLSIIEVKPSKKDGSIPITRLGEKVTEEPEIIGTEFVMKAKPNLEFEYQKDEKSTTISQNNPTTEINDININHKQEKSTTKVNIASPIAQGTKIRETSSAASFRRSVYTSSPDATLDKSVYGDLRIQLQSPNSSVFQTLARSHVIHLESTTIDMDLSEIPEDASRRIISPDISLNYWNAAKTAHEDQLPHGDKLWRVAVLGSECSIAISRIGGYLRRSQVEDVCLSSVVPNHILEGLVCAASKTPLKKRSSSPSSRAYIQAFDRHLEAAIQVVRGRLESLFPWLPISPHEDNVGYFLEPLSVAWLNKLKTEPHPPCLKAAYLINNSNTNARYNSAYTNDFLGMMDFWQKTVGLAEQMEVGPISSVYLLGAQNVLVIEPCTDGTTLLVTIWYKAYPVLDFLAASAQITHALVLLREGVKA